MARHAWFLGWLVLGSIACGAAGRSGSYGSGAALCERMVLRRVRCGQTPPSLAPVEQERCERQGDCWPRIVQRPLVPRLLECMATAPCQVDCFDAVMAGAPMSPAATHLERVCLAKGCGSRCEIAKDLAGASDEILLDVAWCFEHRACDDVADCATGAVIAKAIECAGMSY